VGRHLTQCGLGRGLPPYQVVPYPSNRLITIHQRHGQTDRTDSFGGKVYKRSPKNTCRMFADRYRPTELSVRACVCVCDSDIAKRMCGLEGRSTMSEMHRSIPSCSNLTYTHNSRETSVFDSIAVEVFGLDDVKIFNERELKEMYLAQGFYSFSDISLTII